MSSILDAVTKDAARSGKIPDATGGAASPKSPAPGGGPSRYRAVALVIVLGVGIGGAAAFFAGREEPADDLLTDKVASRANTKTDAAPAARVAGAGHEGAAGKTRRKLEEPHAHGAHKKDPRSPMPPSRTRLCLLRLQW